jgi:hypothetical protein
MASRERSGLEDEVNMVNPARKNHKIAAWIWIKGLQQFDMCGFLSTLTELDSHTVRFVVALHALVFSLLGTEQWLNDRKRVRLHMLIDRHRWRLILPPSRERANVSF